MPHRPVPASIWQTPADLPAARAMLAAVQTLARHRGLHLRQPPPEPDTCCGRGCNGCVWESWWAALASWQEDARTLLAPPGPGS